MKHQIHFTLSAYTNHPMDEDLFRNTAMFKALNLETQLNTNSKLRWHISELSLDSLCESDAEEQQRLNAEHLEWLEDQKEKSNAR